MVNVRASAFAAPTSTSAGGKRSVRHTIRFGGQAGSSAQSQDTVETPQAQLANPHAAFKALLAAIKANNPDDVQTQLEAGADPNARDSLFYTPLHRAINRGVSVVNRLLKAGADPNAQSPLFAAPPIHRNPNDPRGQKILQMGGDPSTMSPVIPETPLDRALNQQKLEIIPALVLGGAQCSEAQRPQVHAALQQLYSAPDLTHCLENAIEALDVRKTTVLLSAGVTSPKLPVIYAKLLDTAVDTAMRKGVEAKEVQSMRLRKHVNALQLMGLLTDYVNDYTQLTQVIAENQAVLFRPPSPSRL